jgi:hypothetical protein
VDRRICVLLKVRHFGLSPCGGFSFLSFFKKVTEKIKNQNFPEPEKARSVCWYRSRAMLGWWAGWCWAGKLVEFLKSQSLF